MNKFVQRVPIASHLVIGLGVFLTYLIFTITYNQAIVKESDDTDKEIFIGTLDIINKHKHECPNLINSFFFPWQDYHVDGTLAHNTNHDDHVSEAYVSNFIFQSVEVYTENSKMTDLSDAKFLCFFSQFFLSKQLKTEWKKYSANFSLKSRLLIEELFQINESNKFNSAIEIREFFEKYVFTDRFKEIITAVDKSSVGHKIGEFGAV